jgi:Ran GTPase-activating protein (RanGAP) involved in mRNA processing and transport
MAFSTLYRCKWLADDSVTMSQMADKLEEAAKRLREMEVAGVRLDGKVQDDYAELITDDPAVAAKYDLQDMDADDEEDEGFAESDDEESEELQ